MRELLIFCGEILLKEIKRVRILTPRDSTREFWIIHEMVLVIFCGEILLKEIKRVRMLTPRDSTREFWIIHEMVQKSECMRMIRT